MSEEAITRELFERWERVWRDGEYDLVPSCVADQYIRHDETGDRIVTPESYAAELRQLMKDRPGIRVLVYDHAFVGNRAWVPLRLYMARSLDRRAALSRGHAVLPHCRRQAG